MASTPEAKVKKEIRDLLAEYPGIWTFWPVPSGYQRRTVDVLGCYRGRFFAIEAKAPGKKPTLNQVGEIQSIDAAMGKTFVIAAVDDPALVRLRAWLNNLTETVENDPHITPDPVRRRTVAG